MENTESSPAERGLSRRTIVQGAAWSVPVIAAAVATPLAAASVAEPTLTFVNGPYSVGTCASLGNVTIQATTDGSAPVAPGTLITVTLPAGLTWSDGSTGSRVLPADANGQVLLTGITATTAVGSPAITASTTGATASAPVTVTVQESLAVAWTSSGVGGNYPSVPANSTPLGAEYFLAPNGDLYYGNTVVQSGVVSATGYTNAINGAYTLNYATATGAGALAGGASNTYPNIPVGSEAIGAEYFLAPNGDLYYGNIVVSTGVTSATGYSNANNGAYTVNYVTSAGAVAVTESGAVNDYSSVPAGSVAVGAEYFLAPNGDLYLGNDVVATGVTSAEGYSNANNGAYTVNYVTANGGFALAGTSFNEYTDVPPGSVAIGAEYFLAPNGDLYVGNQLIASGVPSAVGYSNTNGGAYTVNYIQNPIC